MGPSPFRIIIRVPTGPEKSVSLPAEGVVRVGSAKPSNLLVVAPGVLPTHFFLRCAGGKAALIVQDPAAQVTVNGVETRKRILESGDQIQAGDALLVLEAIERDRLLGETVGGYRIEGRLGKGGMGTVYKATQLSLERDVALKILSPELSRDEAFVKKFLEEAKAAAKLNHQSVVQVYDAAAAPSPLPSATDEPAQLYYFSMEFMPGGTLQRTLDQNGRIPLQKALEVGCDAARALSWAEEHGIVHRDIKPANLLFTADGSVKVADLGIAADIDRMMEGVEGLQGAGSPRYMAPEQAQRKAVDHRVDIYALGATLFRAISGRHVFEGESTTEIVKAKLAQDPPRLDSIDPETPRAVADLLNKMLSRDPSKRPRSCVDTLKALEACLEGVREGIEDEEPPEDAVEDAGGESAPARMRPRRAAGGWKAFIDSGAGKANLSASSFLVLLSLAWPLSAPVPEAAVRPRTTSTKGSENADSAPTGDPQPGPAVSPAVTASPGSTPGAVERNTGSPVAETKSTKGADTALDAQILSIVREYRGGLIDAKRAIAALEDYKRSHTDPGAVQSADTYLNQIRDNATEVGKVALSRFVKGELPKLLEQSEFREATSRLTKIGTAHPLILKDVNDEVARVEASAGEAYKLAEEKSDRAALDGDFTRAREILSGAQATFPAKIAARVKEKLKTLERDEKEFAQLAGPLSAQIEGVRDAILTLEFDRAASAAAALPKPTNAVLLRRRQQCVTEAALAKSAFALVSEAATKAAKSSDPFALFALPARDLVQMLGAQPEMGAFEGLGLLVLFFAGPERARELLLDQRLGVEKAESYKALLAVEGEEHLARIARSFIARADALKKSGKAAKKDWEAFAASLLERIRASRSQKGYMKARASLARAFLKARAEVLRVDAPQSLFKGKVKAYKPDGSIELAYDFNSEEEFKDFVPVRSTSSRLELEGKMAKLRGEFRLGRGDVFRNRVGVTCKLPATGFSQQSPNLNVALWTRDDDRVSPPQKRAGAVETDPDDSPKTDGVPDDFFVFAIGYRSRLPVASSTDGLTVRGSGAAISMPANVILGGLRGEPLHRVAQGDCLWGKPLLKISGAQTYRVVMAAGVVTWSSSSQTLASAKELRDVQLLRRDDPYLGSVTFFTNSDVLFYDSISVEGELNPAWVEEQLVSAAEVELKKVEPAWPF